MYKGPARLAYQPPVLLSQNKPAISNQPAVLFSQNKPAPAISHQPNEQTEILVSGSVNNFTFFLCTILIQLPSKLLM
jgi:hypothetical protein